MELFDLHCDTLCEIMDHKYSLLNNSGAIDLQRGRKFNPWVQTFAVWLPDGLSVETARARCDELLSLSQSLERSNTFSVVRNSDDLITPSAPCSAILSIENGGALDVDDTYLQHLYDGGVRIISLTWNGDNHWGSGTFGSDNGLTDKGRCAVKTMEQVGLITDVSHLNEKGFWDVAERADRPFIATHSASASVYAHPRNLTDDQFRAIRDIGGVVGLCLYPEHLGGSNFETIRRHLEHYIELDGAHSVCFGADFDGMTAPEEWNGISVMSNIKQYLQDCGWSPELINAVFYTNARDFFLRYWKQTIRNEE